MNTLTVVRMCDNESGPGRCVNTRRGLTHSLDSTKEGLAMKATRNDCRPFTGRPHQFQAKAAEAYYVECGDVPATWEWINTTCGTACLNTDHMEFKAPRKLLYPANVCVYCGRSAYTKDHLLPRPWTGEARRDWVATVPACGTCNSVLGPTLTWSITERRSICHALLRRKFRSALNNVMFSEGDLAEFGPVLRSEVIKGMAKHVEVTNMLAWPGDPNYDLRACQRSGIEDPYAIGFIIDQHEADRIAAEVVYPRRERAS